MRYRYPDTAVNRPALTAPCVLIALSCAASVAAAQTAYELHVVPPITDGSTSESSFSSVNESGVALGTTTFRWEVSPGRYRITTAAFLWTVDGGPVVDLDRMEISAINNVGDTAAGGPTGTVYLSGGAELTIEPFPGDVAVSVGAINDNGMVAGHSRRQGNISQGIPREAFYWTPSLGTVGFRDSVPEAARGRDVNNTGQIVGIVSNGLFADNQAFYFDPATSEFVNLHAMLVTPGHVGVRSEANSINASGQVVGWRDTGFGGDGNRAFLWSKASGVTLLPPEMTRAAAINDHGVIVGRHYLFSPDDGLVDLHDLAPTGDFVIASAEDISNSGVIVGWGRRPSSPLPTAFALVPTCRADLNADRVADADDFFLFLQLFAGGDPIADINADGVIDADDFFAYLALFADGC